jgi:hypothetical protein
VWADIASYFQMPAAEVQTIALTEYMSDKADSRDRIVIDHDLRRYGVHELAAWPFLEAILDIEYDIMSDYGESARIRLYRCRRHDEDVPPSFH